MGKIGLITFHDTANHGAALQAYATQHKILDLGYQIEIINYTNSHRSSFYNPNKRLLSELKSFRLIAFLKTLLGYSSINKRMRNFNSFYERDFKLSSNKYTNNSDLSDLNDIYDIYLCGSDQIWSSKNNGGDFNYLLSFADDNKRLISYATSLGMIEISQELTSDYRRLLSRFDYIFVREKPAANLLSSLLDKEITNVLDPVFLLSKDEWLDLSGIKSSPSETFSAERGKSLELLDYTAHRGMLEKFLGNKNVDEKFKSIYKFGTNIKLTDLLSSKVKLKTTSGPKEFIQYINKSDFIFTSSFHGTVLAIIFKKPFITSLSGNKGRDSRVTDLLESLGLLERIFSPNMTEDDIFAEIDYELVHNKLDLLKERSLASLKLALDGRGC